MPRLRLFIFFALGYFLSNFFRAANAVIAGDLVRDLELTAADLGLMTSMFYLGFAAVQLPLGAALDRFGTRLTLPALMLATVAGCLVFASARAFPAVALGRTLIGVGMAGGLMGTLKAFGLWFPPRRVATATGAAVALGAAGALAAATPLAWVSAQVGWRAVFASGALATIISAAAIALGTGNAPAGTPWRTAPGIAGEGFARIFRDVRFWRVAPVNFFLVGTLLAVQTLWGGPYLFDVLQMSPIEGGNLLLALSGGLVVGYLCGGWLADRFGSRPVAIAAIAVFAACQAPMVLPGGPPPQVVLWLAYALFGFTGAFNLLLLGQVRTMFPPQMSGRAVTALNLFGFSGTALIQWWMGLIISRFPPGAGGRYPPEAYAAAFLFTLVGTGLTLLWYLPQKTAGIDQIG